MSQIKKITKEIRKCLRWMKGKCNLQKLVGYSKSRSQREMYSCKLVNWKKRKKISNFTCHLKNIEKETITQTKPSKEREGNNKNYSRNK